MRRREGWHWAKALVVACPLIAATGASQWQAAGAFHSTTPAGYAVVRLQPSGAQVAILGLIECPEMEGARRVSQGVNARIVSAEGVPLRHFPSHFSFRITATLRKTIIESPSDTLMTTQEPEQFLLKLGFRLKIYHGLETREVFPQSVEMIGMPAEISYEERVFRVNFEVENVSITDRMSLQVLSPEEQTVTHFSFGLL